jgi:hypothetical protein
LARVAVSHDTLAVAHERGIALYRLPSGRLIRVVVPPGPPAEPLGGFTLSCNELIFWKDDYIRVVDPATGRVDVLVRTSASHGHESDRVITAVAADGKRVAWAVTDVHGQSVIQTRTL